MKLINLTQYFGFHLILALVTILNVLFAVGLLIVAAWVEWYAKETSIHIKTKHYQQEWSDTMVGTLCGLVVIAIVAPLWWLTKQ